MEVLTTGTVIEWMERWYPPATAASWDKVGLVLGSRETPVRKVLLAVDPVDAVAEQALSEQADLVITHHPLYLRGTSFLSQDDAKGRLVTKLIRADVGLYSAHTNADVAHEGVAQALADLIGLEDQVPMEVGQDEDTGYGRVGKLNEPTDLSDFADLVAERLPAGPTGLLVAGDVDRKIETVAVSGGAGDSFLELVRALGVDAYLTADLRHHPASEHMEDNGPALLCGSHWATEWPWLPVLAERLRTKASEEGHNLEVVVSTLMTEPWVAHLTTKGIG